MKENLKKTKFSKKKEEALLSQKKKEEEEAKSYKHIMKEENMTSNKVFLIFLLNFMYFSKKDNADDDFM